MHVGVVAPTYNAASWVGVRSFYSPSRSRNDWTTVAGDNRPTDATADTVICSIGIVIFGFGNDLQVRQSSETFIVLYADRAG